MSSTKRCTYSIPLLPHIFRSNNSNIFLSFHLYNKRRHMRHLSEKYCYQIGASSYHHIALEIKQKHSFHKAAAIHNTHIRSTIAYLFISLSFDIYHIWSKFPIPVMIMELCYICATHIIAKRPRMTDYFSL